MGDGMRDRNKTTKIGTLPEVEKAKKKSYWDQRIVLLAEVSATVISLLLFWIGLKIKNEIIVGIFSNSFTALLVTIVGTLVSWNTIFCTVLTLVGEPDRPHCFKSPLTSATVHSWIFR